MKPVLPVGGQSRKDRIRSMQGRRWLVDRSISSPKPRFAVPPHSRGERDLSNDQQQMPDMGRAVAAVARRKLIVISS